jgi:pilus assembly protein CpaE
MSQIYDAVVVDTPRTFDRFALTALEQADAVMIVLQLIVPSVRNGLRLFRTLRDYGMPEERIQIVVNRFRKNVGRIMPEDVEAQFCKKVFGIVPNDYQCVTNSLDFGHPLMTDAPSSAVRTAIRAMATQLLKREPEPAPTPAVAARKEGLLSRIFR